MFEEKIRIQHPNFQNEKRIIVISDLHGNIQYFKGLLDKINYSSNDYLILNGDFLEKGPNNIETLRYIMKLSENKNVFPVLGNCDSWYHILNMNQSEDEHIYHYMQFRKSGLIYEMLKGIGVEPEECRHVSEYIGILQDKYQREFDFLKSLPHAVETGCYIFVHAGIDNDIPLKDQSVDSVSERPAFLKEEKSFQKWVIVGHWPVMLYSEKTVNANPIILKDRKIISIDGACVLKDDGQLNALIIPEHGSEDFSWESFDSFPQKTVMDDQNEGKDSYYIRWGDNEVEVLSRGDEFSLCKHIRTGYTMEILTKYLFSSEKVTKCNDCSDYILPLKKGDTVSVVEETSRGYYVKHNGISGWYYGALL